MYADVRCQEKIALNLRYRPCSENNGNEAMKLLFHSVILRADSSAGCFCKIVHGTVRCDDGSVGGERFAMKMQWPH